MIGKTIECEGKLFIAVEEGNVTHYFLTTTDAPAFKRAYPGLLGENVTDGTGVSQMWRGASGVCYTVPNSIPIVFDEQDELVTKKTLPLLPPILETFTPGMSQSVKVVTPLPLDDATIDRPIEPVTSRFVASSVVEKKGKATGQKRKKRVQYRL